MIVQLVTYYHIFKNGPLSALKAVKAASFFFKKKVGPFQIVLRSEDTVGHPKKSHFTFSCHLQKCCDLDSALVIPPLQDTVMCGLEAAGAKQPSWAGWLSRP